MKLSGNSSGVLRWDKRPKISVATISTIANGAIFWVICLFALLAGVFQARAQSFGPPAIAVADTNWIYTFDGTFDFSFNGFSGPCDDYSMPTGDRFEVAQDGSLFWNGSYVANFSAATQMFDNPKYVAVSADGLNFTATSGVAVLSAPGTYYLTETSMISVAPTLIFTNSNGVYCQFFLNPPLSFFSVGGSPYYSYTGGNLLIDGSSGTWPASNIFPNPPQTVYVLDTGDPTSPAYVLGGIQISAGLVDSSGQPYYEEQDDYTDISGAGQQVTIQRYFNNGGFSGSISGVSDQGNYFSGSFDPIAQQVSAISPGNIEVSLSSLGQGTPQGPLYISWDDTLLLYQATDGSGNDYYSDSSGQSTVVINNGSATSGNSPAQGQISGYYNTSTSTFTISDPDFFALDSAGSPIGLPTGLTFLFGSSGPGQQILDSDNNTYSPNYTYRRPDGSSGVKYVGLPANKYFLVPDGSGNFDSQIYVTSDTSSQDMVINAISGWPISNAYPSQLYVNNVLCTLNWNTNYVGGPGTMYGGASYISSDSVSLSLNWNWNGGYVSWYWSMSSGQWNGDAGSWDGVSTFSNLPFGLVISLNPANNTPVVGPSSIAWNGTPLTFNAAFSGASSLDVYQGSYNGTPVQITIDSGGNVSVYLGGSSSPTFTGTYNPVSQLFNFGSANVGTVAAVGNSNNLLGTTSSTGNLDIPGNILSLGSWQNSSGESVSGFSLAFTPPPSSGQAAVLQFGSSLALTDWLWSHSDTDGSASQIKAMELDPNNKLLLYSPSSAPSATIALDPANGASFQVPVRFMPAGDVPMGNFQSGPQPNQ